jgi:uncharacterized protein
MPGVTFFKPAGIPLKSLEEVRLSIEEAEALRLKDLEGLDQEEAAKEMAVSRPTFQRILASARRKVADVLLNGKAVRIEGGNFEVSGRNFKCANGHEWSVQQEELHDILPEKCPVCETSDISVAVSLMSGIDGRCCRTDPEWRPKCHSGKEKNV